MLMRGRGVEKNAGVEVRRAIGRVEVETNLEEIAVLAKSVVRQVTGPDQPFVFKNRWLRVGLLSA
jgi:hypothetical protein